MLAFIMSLITFLPVFIIVDSVCPNLVVSIIITLVVSVIWYFLSMIPIVGDILSIVVWTAAIPFVIINGKPIFTIIYLVIYVVRLVFTIKYMIEVHKGTK